MSKQLTIDGDACISCNLCVDTLPEVFRIDDDGIAEVHDHAGATEEKILEAIDACPVHCIRWQ